MFLKARNFSLLLITMMLIIIYTAIGSYSENVFEVKRIGNIHPYADNAFRVRTSEAGTLEIKIHDNICIYRTISQVIPSGETIIHWDGCGYNKEKLYEKIYTITSKLKTDSGMVYTVSYDSPVEYAAQCLQYALPSSDTIYLDNPDSWFLEYRTVTKGTIAIEFRSVNDQNDLYLYTIAATGGKIAKKDFSAITGKKSIPHVGEYILTVYENSKSEEKYVSSIQIVQESPNPEPVTVTGEIMADVTMSDSEIWEMMMKPSVVVDIDYFKHQNVYAEPDTASTTLGTVHGQTQGLKVIRIEEEWAMVGAWNHEEAEYVEGWVPLSRLKVETPRGDYGILIDKTRQTMTIYQNGQKIDTLLISTGRAEKKSLYQETSAGCFLTGFHRVNFSMNGKKYDYVIQYDGGNLLHQTPYDWGQQKKDFTMGRGYLGAKASHACIRIQPEPAEGGINAYWLFTHIPYHTRVMILDDAWERKAVADKLKRDDKSSVNIDEFNVTDQYDSKTENEENKVEMTFGGCIIPGGTRSFNSRNESFAAYGQKEGYGAALSNLVAIFESDDLTCINLSCVIQKNPELFPEGKTTVFAPAGAERVYVEKSIELIQMTNEKLMACGQSYYDDTAAVIQPYADVLRNGQPLTYIIKGHRFGFAGCTESEYLKDPGIIDRKISELKELNCEIQIMLINWSDNHSEEHLIIQEAMSHRSIRAGADLVVGHCQGIVQGFDLIEGVPVIYSTGDLMNGSTPTKPKDQQGILFRITFGFESDQYEISVTAIPILPYGNNEKKENEYSPSLGLSRIQLENALNHIWSDSTDAALKHMQVYIN